MLTNVNIGSSVTTIGNGSFAGIPLININIPDSVITIGDYTFSSCYSLTNINISNNITSIGNYVFFDCTSLTSIDIPDGVTSIGASAFDSCVKLVTVDIPNNVISIGAEAFDDCTALEIVYIPNSVTSIGDYAFRNCTSLITADVPEGVTLGTGVFLNCPKLVASVFHTVTFMADSTVLKEEKVKHGEAATAPTNPSKSGYVFDKWDRPFDNITSDLTVYAQWKVGYIITLTAGTGGSTTGGGTYISGANVTLTATADSGYRFDGWYESNTRVSTDTTYSFTATSSRTLEARFALLTSTLSINPINFTGITYGDPQRGERNIIIANSSNTDATIASVTLTGANADSFTINGSGDTVPAGGNISTWTVQPIANISAGTHTAMITVTYNNSATATAEVSIIVIKKPPTAADFAYNSVTTYNGLAQPLTITAKAGVTGLGNVTVIRYNGDTTTPTNAGTYTVVVSLAAGTNYLDATALDIGTYTIKKATLSGVNKTYEVAAGSKQDYNFNLTDLLPNATGLTGVTYDPVITANGYNVLGTLNYVSGDTLTLPVLSVGAVGKTATITVTISSSSGNYEDFTAVITVKTVDSAPTATDVSTNATAPEVGTQLTGSYIYTEGIGAGSGNDESTFQWYRSAANTWGGASPVKISGATNETYTPTGADVGKYLYFEVTPSNGTLTGSPAQSPASGQVGIVVSLVVEANDTSGTATIGGGTEPVKVVSGTSPVVIAMRGNATNVVWTVSEGGGTFSGYAGSDTPAYLLPAMTESLTTPITITATFSSNAYTAPSVTTVRSNTYYYCNVSVQVTGSYTYNAGTGIGAGPESKTTFQWYRSTEAAWEYAPPEAIAGATSINYTPVSADAGKYLYFEVIPSNGIVVGSPVHSTDSNPVASATTYTTTITIPQVNGTAPNIGTVTNPGAQTTGRSVNLPAVTAKAGFTFSNWQVTAGGVLITNSTQASNAYFNMGTANVTVNAVFVPATLTFANQTLANGVNGTPYSANVTAATGGSGSYTYTSSDLSTNVPGLSMSAAGVITGTPTEIVEEQTFTVKATDTVSGGTQTATYTITVTATVTGPTGSISIGTNSWNSFLNTVSFGLFCKEKQDITISATGSGGEDVTIQFYLASEEMILADVKALDTEWQDYSGTFSVNPKNKFIVYAKLTGVTSGLTTYINSAGVVLYTDSAPVTASIDFTKGSSTDVTVEVTLNGNTVNKIMNGTEELVKDTHYTVSDGTITFKASYLDTLDASATPYTLTIYYNPMGVEYPNDPLDGSVAPNNTTVDLTVNAQTVLVSSITVSGTGGATTITTDGGTLQMLADVLPGNANNKTITWSITSGGSYATLDSGGLLTAIDNGSVTVRATANDGSAVYGEATIIISGQIAPAVPVTSITVSGTGGATGITTDSGTLQMLADVQPSGATDKTVTWSIESGGTYATLSSGGLLTATDNGSVTVRATANDGSAVYGETTITISGQIVLVTSITVSGTGNATTITTDGGTLQMLADVLPNDATDKSVTWSITGGSSFANINSSGLLIATGNGSVTVRATANDGSDVYGEKTIDISNQIAPAVPVTSITVSGTGNATTITTNGGTLQMLADVQPGDATDKTITWSITGGGSYATISTSGLLTATGNGSVTVRATANDGSNVYDDATIVISGQTVPVTSITVTGTGGATTITTNGGTLQMLADVLPGDATNKTVTWSITGGGSYATISTSGLLTATGNGSVTVRATANDGSNVYDDETIVISGQTVPVTSITVTGTGGATAITTNGGTLQMLADVLPGDATNKTVTWSITSGGTYATISTSGLLTATGNGSVTVRATANDGSNVYDDTTIVISGQTVPVTSITVTGTGNATTITTNGGTLQMLADVLPGDATNKTVTWSITSGGTYATISTNGLLTATGNGSVTVKAVANDGSGKYDEATITISGQIVPVTSVTVTGTGNATTITTNGGTLQMLADVLPNDATNKTVTWSITSGGTYATLNATGLLTATGNGSVTVKATANDGSNVYGEKIITISGQTVPVTSVTVTGTGGASTIATNSGTLQMLADVQPGNATDKTVSWTITSGGSYATISSGGLLTATGNGSITVKATANDGSNVYGEKIITISGQTVPVTSVTVSGTGGATTITADGGTLQMVANILPNDATDKTVSWSITSGSGYANLSSSGLLTATGNGSVTVKATANDGSGKFGEAIIVISGQIPPAVPVTSVTVTGTGGATTITTNGGTLQMLADVLPGNATNKTVTWTITSGSSLATISSSGLLTATGNGSVTVKATANDGSGKYGEAIIVISGQTVPVTSVTVTGTGGATAITADGGALQMIANILPNDATDKTVTWSITSGSGYANLSSSGLLTATGNGSVTVRATANDGSNVYGNATITISGQTVPVTSVTVSGTGGATTITTNGGTLQMLVSVLPNDATDKTVTWTITSGSGYANLSNSGLLTATNNGSVTVRATANDGSGKYDEITIVISGQIPPAVPVTSITVTGTGGASTIITNDGTLQMVADVQPGNATNKTITWSITSGNSYATISNSGLLTAINNGSVTVRATANDGSTEYGEAIIVISGQTVPVTSITVTGTGGATAITANGGTLQMIADVLPNDATDKTVTWTISSGSGYANISNSGLLTATNNGSVTVRATANDGSGLYNETTITISGQTAPTVPVTSVTVSGAGNATSIVTNGGTLQMLADVLPGNATNKAVTWSITSGSGYANISNSGLLTATSNGSVTVRATANDGSNVYGEKTITISGQIVTTVTVTANAGSGGTITPSGAVPVVYGASQTFSISAYSSYSISDVKVDGVSVGAVTSYTFSNVTANHTISATFSYNGGGNGGNTGGDSGSSGGTPTTPVTPPTNPGSTTITGDVNGEKVNITQDKDTGAVSTTVTASEAQKAVETAKTTGEVIITIPKTDTITSETPVEATVSKEAFAAIADSGAVLKLDTPAVTITFDADAVGAITGAGAGNVTISAGFATNLTAEQKNIAGDRPVYDFSVTVGNKTVSEFGGDVTVILPYTPKLGEDVNAIVIYYLDSNGNVKTITGGVYDPTTGTVKFATNHFSLYMIGYNAKTFTDVNKSHWASGYITFVAARGLFNGDNGQFMPGGSMTRAMFAQVLANLEDVELSVYKTSRFSDVAVGQWYAAAVEWAASKGIVSGYDGRFDPNASITREQMAVMLYNYMKYKGYAIPSDTASAFADEAAISSWAYEAVKAIQGMGIVGGKPGNLYDPQATATRAEVATVFTNFVKYVAGVSSTGNKTAATNAMTANSILAMLPGKEDEINGITDSEKETEA